MGDVVIRTYRNIPMRESNLRFKPHRCLVGEDFEISERGEILVKGKGTMKTFFVHQNKKASMEEIMGKKRRTSTPEKRDSIKSETDSVIKFGNGEMNDEPMVSSFRRNILSLNLINSKRLSREIHSNSYLSHRRRFCFCNQFCKFCQFIFL